MTAPDFRAQAVARAARLYGESTGDSVPYDALVDALERALRAEHALAVIRTALLEKLTEPRPVST